jgi:hypothetical protein
MKGARRIDDDVSRLADAKREVEDVLARRPV